MGTDVSWNRGSNVDVYSDLITKPVFAESGWRDEEEVNLDSQDIATQSYCLCCKGERTYQGGILEFYFPPDLGSQANYGFPDPVQRANVFQENQEFSFHSINGEILLAASHQNIKIAQLICPVCKSTIITCFSVLEKGDRQEAKLLEQPNNQGLRPQNAQVNIIKIGEYPDQTTSRLLQFTKYQEDFPEEYEFLIKAEKAHNVGLGAGSVIYIREAYEHLVHQALAANNQTPTGIFKNDIEAANKCAHIIPEELEQRAYGLFGQLSDIAHGSAEEAFGIKQYETLRDIFKIILDGQLEKKRIERCIQSLPTDDEVSLKNRQRKQS
jgi:hypothetical protein